MMRSPPAELLRARLQRDRCANLTRQLQGDLSLEPRANSGSRGDRSGRGTERPSSDGTESFLQSLTPEERQALLSKVAFSQGRPGGLQAAVSPTADDAPESLQAALPAHTASRTEQTKLLSTDHKSGMAREPSDASKASPLDLARLRVQLASLAAENDHLRHQNRAASLAASRANTTAASAVANAQIQGQRLSEDTASRLAELEMQLSRYKAALRDLSVSAEQLAKDNVALASAAVRHKAERDEGSERVKSLEGQVGRLQDLYATGVAPAKRQTSVQAKSRKDFWATLATPEVLELSRPPADFPVPEMEEVPTHIRPLLGKVQSQERRREELEKEVKKLSSRCASLEEENHELTVSSKRDRHKLRQISATAKTRLMGSVRRIHYLVQQEQSLRDTLKAKDGYILRLEKHLLAQNRAMQRGLPTASPASPPPPKACGGGEAKHSRPCTKPSPSVPQVQTGARVSTRISPGATHLSTPQPLTIDSKSPSITPDPILGDECAPPGNDAAPRKRRHSAIDPGGVLEPGEAATTTSAAGSQVTLPSQSTTPSSHGNAALWGTPLAGLSEEMRQRLGPVASSWRLFTARGSSSGSSSEGSGPDRARAQLRTRDTPETIPEAQPLATPAPDGTAAGLPPEVRTAADFIDDVGENSPSELQQPSGSGDGLALEQLEVPGGSADAAGPTLDEVSELTRRLKDLRSAAGGG